MRILRQLMIAGTARLIQKLLPCIDAHADEVYDFFVARPEQWVVFIGTPSLLDVDRLPRMDKWMWGREPLGLPSFRVPKLQNALVTVFCISKDGLTDLLAFSSQIDRPTGVLQGGPNARTLGQQASLGDAADRAAPEK